MLLFAPGATVAYNAGVSTSAEQIRVACDAMCGGLARWLRVLGVDASYTPGISDPELLARAQAERRTVLSSDAKMFERRLLADGELPGVLLPVGLRLQEQVRFVVRQLAIAPGFPRCTRCNGELVRVSRAEVGDTVPARSLVWATEFYRCAACRHVYWEGTHWQRIRAIRQSLNRGSVTDPEEELG